jgi:hypothetical protein
LSPTGLAGDGWSRRSHPPLPMPMEWPLQLPNITALELVSWSPRDLQILNLVPCLRRLILGCLRPSLLDSFWVGEHGLMERFSGLTCLYPRRNNFLR